MSPWSAARPCRRYGCRKTSTTGWCEEHQKEADIKERQRKQQRQQTHGQSEHKGLYNTAGWKALRVSHLKRSPLCVECGLPGTHVDHIHPHHGDPVMFFSRDNLQTLCVSHHSRKTAKRDGGFGNPKR